MKVIKIIAGLFCLLCGLNDLLILATSNTIVAKQEAALNGGTTSPLINIITTIIFFSLAFLFLRSAFRKRKIP